MIDSDPPAEPDQLVRILEQISQRLDSIGADVAAIRSGVARLEIDYQRHEQWLRELHSATLEGYASPPPTPRHAAG